jgi:hypothetical protein
MINTKDILISQYLAALEMLKECIEKCPEIMWNNPLDKNKFWHVVYHALFYTHLYLQDSEKTFTPWKNHQEAYRRLGKNPDTSQQVEELIPVNKASMLTFLSFCQQQVRDILPEKNLEIASGFFWLPFSSLELQIYSIRHIQQHVGELMERLGSQAEIDLLWVGTIPI